MTDIRNIVILTGAGVSAESGIGTFREKGGLWEQHRIEDVATPEGFARNPDLVLSFYDMRRERIKQWIERYNDARNRLSMAGLDVPARARDRSLLEEAADAITENLVEPVKEAASGAATLVLIGALAYLWFQSKQHEQPCLDGDGPERHHGLTPWSCGDKGD